MAKNQTRANNENPIVPGVSPVLLSVANQQIVVAAVGLPGYVGHVADGRDRAQRIFDGQIQNHTHQGDAGNSSLPGRKDDKDRGEGCEGIANARNQTDDGVQTEANTRSGDDETIVEPSGNHVEVFVGSESGIGRRHGFDTPRERGKNFSVNVGLGHGNG